MSARRALLALVAAAQLGALSGCSAIPAGAPPAPVAGAGATPMPRRLAVAQVVVTLAGDEAEKRWSDGALLDPLAIQEELAGWISASPLFARVRRAAGATAKDAVADAWAEGDDLLLEVRLADLRTAFDGHNGWWIPNIITWTMWVFPSWWVATEEYSLSFTAEVVVRGVDSQRPVHERRLPITVRGTFDDFDRGWQAFGVLYPRNDAENWQTIAGRLWPAALSELGAALALELGRELRGRLDDAPAQDRLQKTMAVVVGASRHRDPGAHPPVPFADQDARALAAALTEGAGLPGLLVTTLVDADATRAGLLGALDEARARMRDGDQLVVAFAGYGTRDDRAAPALLLHDAGDGAGGADIGRVTLDELGAALKGVAGRKLVLLDCGFDGKGRSVARSVAAPAAPDADARRLAEAAGAVVLTAGSAGGAVLAIDDIGAGLFTHHVVRGLRGAADADHDGRITAAELAALVRDRTAGDAAFFGAEQRPSAAGLDRPFALSCDRAPK